MVQVGQGKTMSWQTAECKNERGLRRVVMEEGKTATQGRNGRGSWQSLEDWKGRDRVQQGERVVAGWDRGRQRERQWSRDRERRPLRETKRPRTS